MYEAAGISGCEGGDGAAGGVCAAAPRADIKTTLSGIMSICDVRADSPELAFGA